jgi:UDP-4-amino-4,6-dideoxy-N-acetyl-beta-L-altrosamine transaminase
LARKFLQYNLPLIEEDEIAEVVETLRSGWLTMGHKTMRFEQLISEYTGAKQAIALNSCTAALHLSLVALGIGRGDDVITTPYTFAATGNTIVNAGARPVFVDITLDTYNIDPDKIEERITPETKAIIPVHYAGQSCDMKTILDIAEDHGLFVVEDAAHAIGAEYDGRKIGTFGTTTCFSFYATKNMTTGEGGAITTEDESLADRLRIMRLHGISKDAWNRYSEKGKWYYEIEEAGWKYNMTDIQAALGIHQIHKLDKFIDVRREYAQVYDDSFYDLENVITPFEDPCVKHIYHLYPLLLDGYNRDEFIEEMYKRGIGCSVHFIPLHLHPFYRSMGFKKGDFPNAEWVYEREVSLPLYPKMSRQEVDIVAANVREIIQN